MTDIYEIKEATLASLEAIISKQQFDNGIKQVFDKCNTLVFTFRTLPDNPDQVVVELMSQPRLFPEDTMYLSGQAYSIRLRHSRRKAVNEPNDISLGITKDQFTKFLHLCCPNPKERPMQLMSQENLQSLRDTYSLCAREADSIRNIALRLERFPIPLKPIHAANESLEAGLMNVRDACMTLGQLLTDIERDEWQLAYHISCIEGR